MYRQKTYTDTLSLNLIILQINKNNLHFIS